jgi:ATP-dependent helicase/nuclease subunit A
MNPSAALHPQVSAVVEACAGSGKTWMLVSRILRLLLAGVPPADILAITFTRLAAREMEERLVEWLKFLALEPDEAVVDFMKERGLSDSEARQALPQARSLFEAYLLASPSVTLCTFDVWFLRLLRHAPLSSNLRRDSTPGPDTQRVRQEAWQQLLGRHTTAHPGSVGASLEWLFRHEGLFNTRNWILSFADWRAEWWAFTEGQADPVAYATLALQGELGVDTEQDVAAGLLADPWFGAAHRTLAEVLSKGSAALNAAGMALQEALSASDPLEALAEVLLVRAGTPRQNILKAARAAGDAALAAHTQLLQQVVQARQQVLEQASLRVNAHLFRTGQAYLEILMTLMQARGEAGFQDVQWSVCTMLESSEQAEYLQYRLDARYRHLLLDEFQDTSPLQWRTLKTWLQAARDAEHVPTVFLVGDPKQAIYRFRRADPRLFDEAAAYLEAEWGALRVSLNQSRRSGPAIIGLVNRVFGALPDFGHFSPHEVAPGAVCDAVQLLESDEVPESEVVSDPSGGMRNPLETPRSVPAETREAWEGRAFAKQITQWVGPDGLTVQDPHVGVRPARYGDIIVLVRRRGLLEPYERALRAARIPYLTRQRGGLLGTLEVRDMRQLLRFLVNPQDNLALAQVLRSPIFGAGDEDLLVLAQWPHWWPALQQPLESTVLEEARRQLSEWMSWAVRLPVHDLLDRILGESDMVGCYQRHVPVALHASIEANLHAFLEQALNLDSGRYPSLPRFLQELDDLESFEQDAPDEGGLGAVGNAVRIMTIHAAKGLEAPVVWLLEPREYRKRTEAGQWFVDWLPGEGRPQHFSLIPSKDELGPARLSRLEQEKRLDQREDYNLLYVALTRARQLLVVSGRAEPEASAWFKLVCAAAAPEITVRRAAAQPCSKSSE